MSSDRVTTPHAHGRSGLPRRALHGDAGFVRIQPSLARPSAQWLAQAPRPGDLLRGDRSVRTCAGRGMDTESPELPIGLGAGPGPGAGTQVRTGAIE